MSLERAVAAAAVAACVTATAPRAAAADEGLQTPRLTVILAPDAVAEPAPPEGAPDALVAVFDAAVASRRYARAYATHYRTIDALLERHGEPRAREAFVAHFLRLVSRDRRERARVAALRTALEREGAGSWAETPEVLFLAAHLEAVAIDLDFEEALADAEASGTYDVEPPDYRPAMARYEAIVREHPEHAVAAASLYLWSHYAAEMGDARAVSSLLALVCPSRFEPFEPAPLTWNVGVGDPLGGCAPGKRVPRRVARRAWLRVGSEFFAMGELPWSVAALRRAADDPSSPAWAIAMYMRGWALYRMDAYADAVDVLDELGGAGGSSRPSVYPEAVQLIAVMLTETWDGGAAIDPPAAIERAIERYGEGAHKAHSRDVFLALAEALRDLDAPLQAAHAYREGLRVAPEHPDNPSAHLDLLRLLADGSDREELITECIYAIEAYAEGAAWWKANAGDPEALAERARTVAWALRVTGRD